MYMQMWHYPNTHSEQYDYFKDVLACDALCLYNEKNAFIPILMQNVLYPRETDNYLTNLKATQIANIHAIGSFKK